MTLEAFADTLVPGEKRFAEDAAIAGAAPGPGAVVAGALTLLETPAGGVSDGLDDAVDALNTHASAYADEHGIQLDGALPAFVALDFAHRSALVRLLTDPGQPEKESWILIAVFCFMAFDTAAHMDTIKAIETEHPGLKTMGYASPDADGLWRFPDFGYGRELARTHPETTPSGDPA